MNKNYCEKTGRYLPGNDCMVKHGHTKHGKRTKIYTCWRNMMNRCYQESTERFKNYGLLGISVCERWHSFDLFLEDMGDVPDGMTLERINVYKNYDKENCKWATQREQGYNKRNSINVEYQGVTKNLSEWIRELGLNNDLVRKRLKLGWDIKKSFEKPSNKRNTNEKKDA